MKIYNKTFHRLFSQNFYKNLKLPLGQMTFTKDFINDSRGDPYPVLQKTDDCRETVENNRYAVHGGRVSRVLGQFFPYATYEVGFETLEGSVGFLFRIASREAMLLYNGKQLIFSSGEVFRPEELLDTLIVSCRPGAFDVYTRTNGAARFLHTFRCGSFANAHLQKEFSAGIAALSVTGTARIREASFYIDCGISQADIRPIRYEDGCVMLENGKIYLTVSIRMQAETFQGVFSWVPGTAQFALTGALFYDCGDGKWCGDVAASVLYHREKRKWLLWVCAFSHGHILAHAAFDGDPRFGVNVIDVELMPKPLKKAGITEFCAIERDEDPDFFYDKSSDRWLMAICRMDPAVNGYRYVFFESEDPFEGYRYLGGGLDGAETGGSFVNLQGETVFACGNDFHKVSDYRIYTRRGMHRGKFDFPDGGFRGWGTLIPVSQGSRTRYYWLTFDRHNGSDYNWSYGNLYCFEAM